MICSEFREKCSVYISFTLSVVSISDTLVHVCARPRAVALAGLLHCQHVVGNAVE